MEQGPDNEKQASGNALAQGVGIGIVLGAGIGAVIGVLLDNLALGIPIGVGIGIVLGAVIGSRSNPPVKHERAGCARRHQEAAVSRFPREAGTCATRPGMLRIRTALRAGIPRGGSE